MRFCKEPIIPEHSQSNIFVTPDTSGLAVIYPTVHPHSGLGVENVATEVNLISRSGKFFLAAKSPWH